jgi:hypothetical protein
MDDIIEIRGDALLYLTEMIKYHSVRTVRIAKSGEHDVKIKINEEMWSPPIATDSLADRLGPQDERGFYRQWSI